MLAPPPLSLSLSLSLHLPLLVRPVDSSRFRAGLAGPSFRLPGRSISVRGQTGRRVFADDVCKRGGSLAQDSALSVRLPPGACLRSAMLRGTNRGLPQLEPQLRAQRAQGRGGALFGWRKLSVLVLHSVVVDGNGRGGGGGRFG